MSDYCKHELVKEWCAECNGSTPKPFGLRTRVAICVSCETEFILHIADAEHSAKCPDCRARETVYHPSSPVWLNDKSGERSRHRDPLHEFPYNDPALYTEFASWEDDYSEDSMP